MRWDDCGPLRAWIAAYPCTDGLIPRGLSIYQAARRLTALREEHSLTYDVLRHTGASAMLHVPNASFTVISSRLENSETVLKDHYQGLWCALRTTALYAILPAGRAGMRPALPMLRAS